MQQFPQGDGNRRLEFDAETAEAGRAMRFHDHELFSKANVQGIGFGHKVVRGQDTGEPAMKVLVSHKLPQDMLGGEDLVPEQVENLRTDVEAVGEFFAGQAMQTMPRARMLHAAMGNGAPAAMPEAPWLDFGGRESSLALEEVQTEIQLLRNRVRPASGGYSVAHRAVTAGTIATGVYDASAFPGIPPRYYILSNNHVLANSNNASVGDPILQPGPADGGSFPADVIGRLSRWVTIRFGGPDNLVDAAIAEAPFNVINREVYWIGYVQGVRNNWPTVGETLQKTGRTTNYTTGRVVAINATVNVNFGGGGVARFVQQIITNNMSAGGDSGSLVLDMNKNAMGLLFAGSASHTILNHIFYVQALLGIRVY